MRESAETADRNAAKTISRRRSMFWICRRCLQCALYQGKTADLSTEEEADDIFIACDIQSSHVRQDRVREQRIGRPRVHLAANNEQSKSLEARVDVLHETVLVFPKIDGAAYLLRIPRQSTPSCLRQLSPGERVGDKTWDPRTILSSPFLRMKIMSSFSRNSRSDNCGFSSKIEDM